MNRNRFTRLPRDLRSSILQVRFPYGRCHLAGIQEAAEHLRAMFPDISVDLTFDCLMLSNLPRGNDREIMHVAALQLIHARKYLSSGALGAEPKRLAQVS